MSFSIRARLYGGFTVLLVFLLISYLVAANMLNHLNTRMNRLVEHDMEKVRMAGLLEQSVLDITRLEYNTILSDNPDEMRRFAEQIAKNESRLQMAIQRLHELSSNDQEQAILQHVTADVELFIAVGQEVRRLGMLNSNVHATHKSENEGRHAMLLAEQALESLVLGTSEAAAHTDNPSILRQQVKQIVISQEMLRLLITIHKDEIGMILATDDARMDRHARDMEQNETRLSHHYDTLLHMLDREEDLRTLQEFDRHRQVYLEIYRQVRHLTRENGNHRSAKLSQTQGWPVLARLRDASQALSVRSVQLMNEGKQQSDEDFVLAFSILSTMLCLSIVVGAVLALRVSRAVNLGLDRAMRVVEAIAQGDLGYAVSMEAQFSHDEFGQLMHSLSRLVEAENRVADVAQRLAQEDLSVTVVERSAHDRLLNAMKHLSLALQERNELRRMLLIAEKMSSIGQFAVRVVHEVNNPLSIAAMGLQNLRFMLPPPLLVGAVADRINQVESNIERATHVVRQMLEYSWTGQPECSFFDLREELQEVLELIQADARPLAISMEIPEALRVWGDRVMISQLFLNLIKNAMDATPDNGLVRVCARHNAETILAEVRDNGPGIPPEIEKKIFDPFFTTKKSGLGVGLGLPICYSIVQMHGGTLTVSNDPDGGVLASLRLPIHHDPARAS